MPKVPKMRSLHIFAISPEKHEEVVVLLSTDKYESFQQGDSIILGVCNKACPKYPKQKVIYKVIAVIKSNKKYLKENRENEVDFLLADKHQKFLKIDTIILVVCGQACPN